MKNFSRTVIIFSLLILSQKILAYPDFIGYGYGQCMSCHYNGQGNGPLTDYGRGVFGSELVAKTFFDSKITDEELSERSGFLGKTPLPWWIRPGVKYRGLFFQTNPGSNDSVNRVIHMQADMSVAIHFDQEQKLVFVGSFGYYPVPENLKNDPDKPTDYISREHYLRYIPRDDLTLFAGLMDKAFGIRLIDHTAYSRSKVGVAQNDQTYGIMAIYRKEPWELTPHVFIGNLSQKSELRQKGFSIVAERDLHQYHRVGGSLMISENSIINWTRFAGHSKLGFGKGNSFLSEVGFIQNKPKGGESKTGGYTLLQSLAQLHRGYYFLSQAEYYNATLSTKSADNLRWSFGLLSFPYLKTEYRLTFVNGRNLSDDAVSDDSWSIQMQLHLSL